nr:hypothetical protein SHINE37_100027 [Rhizobiaceae bacterium]CAI0335817.1 hypothetical protein SHINE37_20026 [Rhizobiaceae bacterium]
MGYLKPSRRLVKAASFDYLYECCDMRKAKHYFL